MTDLPTVSVVTPSFNQGKYLVQAIQSVLSQDYPALEYILIDGGSTDSSVEIIKRHAPQLAYWESRPDSGQAEAINKGFAKATGRYVAWLNSDDIYLPGAISSAVKAFQRNPDAGLVYGNALRLDPGGRPTAAPRLAQYTLPDLLCMRILKQPAVFARRRLIESLDGLDPGFHYMLDHHLWVRAARLAPIVFIDDFWAAARQHARAKNVKDAARFAPEALRLLEDLRRHEDINQLLKDHKRQVKAGLRAFEAGYLISRPLACMRTCLQALAAHPPSLVWVWRLMGLSVLRGLRLRGAESHLSGLGLRRALGNGRSKLPTLGQKQS